MKKKKPLKKNIIRGNYTHIDPTVDVNSAFVTLPITTNNTPPKINQPPIIPEDNVIRGKNWVDENKR